MILQSGKKSTHYHHILPTSTPQTWLRVLMTFASTHTRSFGTDARPQPWYQLSDTDSGASILINPILPSIGWAHADGNHEMINTLQPRKVSCDGGKRREEKMRKVRTVQCSVNYVAASRINITAHCSAKYLFLSASVFWFLSKYQPIIQSSSLVLTTLFPPSFPHWL